MSRAKHNNDDDDDNNKRGSLVSEDDFEGGTKQSFLRRLSKSDKDFEGKLSKHGSTSSMNLVGLSGGLKQSMLNLCHSIQSKIVDKEHKSSVPSIDASQLPPKSKKSKKDKDNYDTVSLSGDQSSFKNSFRQSFINKFKISGKDKSKKRSEDSVVETNPRPDELAHSTSRLSVSNLDLREDKHPKLKVSTSNQVSPKSPINTTPALSPTSLREISYPKAVDNEKMQEFTSSKQSTIQKMLDQALHQYQTVKEEYDRNPTDVNQTNVESQEKVIRRLKSQLSQTMPNPPSSGTEASLPLSSSGASMKETDRRSSCMENSASSLDDKEDSSSSSCGLPLHAYHQVPRNNSKLCSKLKGRNAFLNSSLSRSHSDSYKQRQEYLDSLKPSASSDDFRSIAENATIGKRRQILSRSHSKSQGGTSDGNLDADQLDPLAEEHSASSLDVSNSTNSISGHRNSQQSITIMAFDEEDIPEEMERRENQFSKFEEIRNKPPHLAVFLHYLISNSDPAPLLFYLVTEGFGQGSGKEIRRWAYELYSTFLYEKAPLKFVVKPTTLKAIHEILSNKSEKDDKLCPLFEEVRATSLAQVRELFGDFGNKLSLGLGSFYGEHELKDVNSPASEIKFIEKLLWRQFTTLAGEDNDRSSATCSALLTYLRSINFPQASGHQEKITPFIHKEKAKFYVFSKSSKKTIQVAEHNLQPHQYCTVTICNLCHGLIGGVGFQGYVCQKCDQNFHKSCISIVKDRCTSKRVDRSKTTPNIIRKKISIKGSQAVKIDIDHADAPNLPRAISLMSLKDTGSSNRSSRFFLDKSRVESSKDSPFFPASRLLLRDDSLKSGIEQVSLLGVATGTKFLHDTFRGASPEPDDDAKEFYDPVNKLFPNQHIPALMTNSQFEISLDSDLEVETDVPALESFIPKDCLRKMKPKEKKRQNLINELFHTERNHVRNMKVMHHVIYTRMNSEFPKDFVNLLFPNLDELIKVHDELNKEFKRKRSESENYVVENFADILVNHFTGDVSNRFKRVCAVFCEKQSQALEKLKARQKKDQKLSSFLQEAANNPLCRRFELKDLLPTAMQRLTKYPLFISGLLKYTTDTDECRKLELALAGSKSILGHVDKAVQKYENHLKLVEMQRKLDRRAIESATSGPLVEYKSLDLTRHSLVCEGSLTWRMSKERLIPLHVVLLDDILLLLQKQDDRLAIKCQSMYIAAGKIDTRMTHSPIIKLINLLIKPVATDPLAFFIVSQFTSFPQIYDLIAPSKEEKDRWCKRITEAADAYKMAHPEATETKPIPQPKTRAYHRTSAPTTPPVNEGASTSAALTVPQRSRDKTAIPELEEEAQREKQPSSLPTRGEGATHFSYESQVGIATMTEPAQDEESDKEYTGTRSGGVGDDDDDSGVDNDHSEIVKLRRVDKKIHKLMREKISLVDSLMGDLIPEQASSSQGMPPAVCIQSLLLELDDVLKLCSDLENHQGKIWSCSKAGQKTSEDSQSCPNDFQASLDSQSKTESDGVLIDGQSDSQPHANAEKPEQPQVGDGPGEKAKENEGTNSETLVVFDKSKQVLTCLMIQTELLNLLESISSMENQKMSGDLQEAGNGNEADPAKDREESKPQQESMEQEGCGLVGDNGGERKPDGKRGEQGARDPREPQGSDPPEACLEPTPGS